MEPPAPLCLALAAMGTRFELVLPEVPRGASGIRRLRAVGEAALDEVRDADARWTRFRRDSFLAHVVATAGALPVRLDEDAYELFDAARRVFELSGGAFDPCVAAQQTSATVRRARERAPAGTYADVELDAGARTVRFRAPGLALDLGGIAKGHALDRATRVLVEAGVRTALLHGGTSAVCALGSPHEALASHSSAASSVDQGWRVQLGAGEDAPEVRLVDSGLAVSAAQGHRNSRAVKHVIDTRRGAASSRAARHDTALEASAVHLALAADPAPLAFADALATALLVTGEALAPARLAAVTQLTKPRNAPWSAVAGPTTLRTRATTLTPITR
jgi:thiamine biosynthesis lipoprotein ApbE